MIYELREYRPVPGRIHALIRRFNDHVVKLLAKHDMELVFLALTEFGANTMGEIVYVLKFDSYGDLETKWRAFLSDPEWREAAKASEADGPLVASMHRRILNPTPFA
ncbi:MAG: hypothetical protein QOE23_1301 [Pseudonocardiales bacterium]|nr:hypothetical protein [Pseudonocardiales bacterium]